jgi:hypothetical protein
VCVCVRDVESLGSVVFTGPLLLRVLLMCPTGGFQPPHLTDKPQKLPGLSGWLPHRIVTRERERKKKGGGGGKPRGFLGRVSGIVNETLVIYSNHLALHIRLHIIHPLSFSWIDHRLFILSNR